MTGPMDTMSERMRQLDGAGWNEQLIVEGGRLTCGKCAESAGPDEARVNEVHRFEGVSDPGDESILFAISMPCGHRGTLATIYGPETPTHVAEFVSRLQLGYD
ncbi:MAG: hypothetical protein ABI894_16500 [Ilumatobacteraceae bacterium]